MSCTVRRLATMMMMMMTIGYSGDKERWVVPVVRDVDGGKSTRPGTGD
jgi:hypothetical protein